MRFLALLGLCISGLAVSPRAIAQTTSVFIPATKAFENSPVCSASELQDNHDLARLNPEWKAVLGLNIDPANPVLNIVNDPPTILEGVVPSPPANLGPNDQPTSEVSEEDIGWNHYSHDFTFKVVPDGPYQKLLSSWVRVPPETCTDNPDNPNGDVCHHTDMEVEWENASLMDENGDFQRIAGAVPEFVWPGVGDRVWVSGRWIFDCGHPNVPASAPQKDFVKFSTEIHPPRALVTYRLNHPALDTFPVPRVSAPNFPGPQSYLPVTGIPAILPPDVPNSGPTAVAVTEADIYVTGNGGGANDLCMILASNSDNDCQLGHTTSVIPVNNTNYVFDVYPPGTDYLHTGPSGTFLVTPPVPDASLQWRIENHFSELPAHTCGGPDNTSCVTVDPIICLIDDKTPPPTQAETGCPTTPAANPTRLRVILPFNGSAANFFAQSLLLGWDDVPTPGSNVGGQYRYIDPFFDRNSDGSTKCNGDALPDNGDGDCFLYDQTPWIVSVQDGTPIHVAVGGWESDVVDGDFCKQFPPGSDCDPFGTIDILHFATQENDRIGPYEFDLLQQNNYQWVDADGNLLTEFHTHDTSDGERYKVEFRVEEIPAATAPVSNPIQIGAPQFGNFVSSATPVLLSSASPDAEGFQFRSYAQGTPLPVYPAGQPFPVHWTHADLPAGSQSVGVFLTGGDGPNVLQYSAESFGNLLEPRHTTTTLALDNTPPVVSIVQPQATAYTHSASITLNFSANDGNGSGVASFTPTISRFIF